ncbi:hypothetical protein AXF42_Ash014995 [Apostasia shenzhenica]|uniref:60S ribosomal protein L41 n=1 Tax=Apostasia shenzhenica TaxID=1088818 RepID=A0A2I0B2U9_9ASPA|nr:hypothetical protein AXF42_Ash014995 [Apostasia shenzhenica]
MLFCFLRLWCSSNGVMISTESSSSQIPWFCDAYLEGTQPCLAKWGSLALDLVLYRGSFLIFLQFAFVYDVILFFTEDVPNFPMQFAFVYDVLSEIDFPLTDAPCSNATKWKKKRMRRLKRKRRKMRQRSK